MQADTKQKQKTKKQQQNIWRYDNRWRVQYTQMAVAAKVIYRPALITLAKDMFGQKSKQNKQVGVERGAVAQGKGKLICVFISH